MDESSFLLIQSTCIFLVTRAGWLVTKIYEHNTFYQSKFEKQFVIMNQNSRQMATSSIEK